VPTDKARELIKPSKNAESLLVSMKKLGSFGFEIFCWRRRNRGRFRIFWPTSSALSPNSKEQFFVSLKKLGEKPHLESH